MGENRRGHGGVNSRKSYLCFICGKELETYDSHKRHVSSVHGKSTRGYDKILDNVLSGDYKKK